MFESRSEHFDRDLASHESEDALAQESQNIGILISQILKLNVNGSHEEIPSPGTRFQVHVGQNRWITVEIADYNNNSPKDGALLRSFTVRLGESDATSPREWIINELFDRKQGVRYQPFFHDYRHARTEISERQGSVPPELAIVDDPNLADLLQTAMDLGICVEELKLGRKRNQRLSEFSFTRLAQESNTNSRTLPT